MMWFENQNELAEAIAFLIQYDCCFHWNAYTRKKTPCCDYCKDVRIPVGLEEALWAYISDLPKEERKNLNRQFSLLLGECFYVREAVIVKILSLIMADGDPRTNKEIIAFALRMQIKQRMELLEKLKLS